MSNNRPIGIFDSGIGGISVLQWLREELPNEKFIYIADSGHMPYGVKPKEFIEERSIFLTKFLLDQQAKAIVVACNTATAAAISTLRSMYSIPFIGMEPGVKPALSITKTGVVGILATQETLNSQKFEVLTNRFAEECQFVVQDCPGLVELVEHMDLNGQAAQELVEQYVLSLLDKGADTIVLGCTHYPFLLELIENVAGKHVTVIDTGQAVARETSRRLGEERLLCDDNKAGSERFFTTGDRGKAQEIIGFLWEGPVDVHSILKKINKKNELN
ncbi:MAG: glutamate racemase [Deltaproteobacteria bacterium]|nr:glutamate racemase [Deltaproteobacteria bacterium]MBW2181548.1 glutamate racemase [Deltaproteobacteria bacterium]